MKMFKRIVGICVVLGLLFGLVATTSSVFAEGRVTGGDDGLGRCCRSGGDR
jgi:hypothetical protein